jgi:serine protease inhibitor
MVNLSNSIWLNEGIGFKQEGLEVLKDSFYTDSYQAPFTSNNALANKAVKDFIFRSTKGLIDKEYYFDQDTLFLLINTMYLKDTWNSDGSKLNLTNIDYKFQNQNNTVKQLKLMLGHYVGGKTKIGDGFEYFNSSISYNLKLHFIKPTTKELNEVFTKENLEIVIKDKKFETVNDELKEYYYTRCIFPEFDASFDEDMSSFFKEEYQLSKIFRDRVSNFNKITDDICFVKNIIHQSKLTVDRVGVEGSAITIIDGNGATAAPEQRYTNVFYDFIVDKSFGFIITYYDAVLFSGVVNNL